MSTYLKVHYQSFLCFCSSLIAGWFRETLPKAPIHSIAFLRADGDMYESTMDVLNNLYSKVVVGGIVFIDDYGAFQACKRAVDEFRLAHGVQEPMHPIFEETGSSSARSEA